MKLRSISRTLTLAPPAGTLLTFECSKTEDGIITNQQTTEPSGSVVTRSFELLQVLPLMVPYSQGLNLDTDYCCQINLPTDRISASGLAVPAAVPADSPPLAWN